MSFYQTCVLKGLTDTAKKNFGGGNTAWEEKTLSKYESRYSRYYFSSQCANMLCNEQDQDAWD